MGNKNSGRQLAVTTRAQKIADRAKLFEVLETIATDAKAKGVDRIAAVKLILAYAHGAPAQQVDVTSGGKPLLILGRP